MRRIQWRVAVLILPLHLERMKTLSATNLIMILVRAAIAPGDAESVVDSHGVPSPSQPCLP